MIIALASPRVATSIDDGLARVERLMADAAARRAEIVCFPEAYLPGLRGLDFDVPPFERQDETRVLDAVAGLARRYAIATILGMEHVADTGRQIVAAVFDSHGRTLGAQTKTQLDPSEDRFYVPGNCRTLFEVNGVKFGIAICHEGWRYPETVRWAAVRGAAIVFHPQHTGSEQNGTVLDEWGAASSPYYEKAMMMRSRENTIYFASVNYALRFQESATSLIAPTGDCQAYLPYGQEGVLVAAIDPAAATGLLARRFAPERYEERHFAAPGTTRTRR
jgi:predicted amidohydrolase